MTLKERLKNDLRARSSSTIDWDKRREEWIASMNDFKSMILDWFEDYQKEGLVTFSFSKKAISEEFVGLYDAEILQLQFSNGKEIVLEPMGSLVIGASGRYDLFMRGFNSDKYYILKQRDDDDTDYSWFVVSAKNVTDNQKLSKESLEQIIEKWLS